MGGPNDQGMSSTWFHFKLKILEHLTFTTAGAGQVNLFRVTSRLNSRRNYWRQTLTLQSLAMTAPNQGELQGSMQAF